MCFVMKDQTALVPEAPGSSNLQVAALFAGVGGVEAGLHQAGHRTSLFCEIDSAALAVLEERFAGTPLHADVRTLSGIGEVDLLTAGFPCQDLSQAGGTRGMDGEHSSLVSHVFRILEERRVPWVLLENVPFMLQLARGRALDYIVTELERLGYRWAYRVMDSRAFGLPQRRERVFLLASLDSDPRSVLFGEDAGPEQKKGSIGEMAFGFYWTEGNRGLGWAVDAIPTLKGGSTIGIPSPPAILLPSGEIVKPDIRDAERLQGFEADWTRPAEQVGRKSHRWKLIGNAVSVPSAAWIGRSLARAREEFPVAAYPVKVGKSWPKAAWNVGAGRFGAKLSTWPVRTAAAPLTEFLRYEPIPLSRKATAGFFSRAKASSLRFAPGFLEAVETHLRRMEAEEGVSA
jgi:DNA (cytosine-5)-methyltransferase 1